MSRAECTAEVCLPCRKAVIQRLLWCILLDAAMEFEISTWLLLAGRVQV